MVGGSCINDNCDFLREVRKFFGEDTARQFKNVTCTSEFQHILNRSAKSLNYHKDGTITLKSFLELLPVHNAMSTLVTNVPIPDINKSLTEIARTVLGSLTNVKTATKQINGEDRFCIDNLSYQEAENIQISFNQSNPFSDKYIASIENIGKSYQVVILNKNNETYLHMRELSPRQAAIDAVCKWFDNLGIHITFDTINDALSASLKTENRDVLRLDGMTDLVLTTLVSICSDRDLKAISDIPENISDDVANAVSKILVDIFDKADPEDVGPQYNRLKQAVKQYKKNNNILNTSDEEIMQMYIKDEIKRRFYKALQKLTNDKVFTDLAVDAAMRYGRSRVGKIIDSIISKWKTTKRLIGTSLKPISIKSIQREARLAVDELFDQKHKDYIKEHQGSVDVSGVKKHHKRVLKQAYRECKNAFDIAYGIERSLKKYINAVSGKEHKSRMTEFENLIAMLNNVDDVFGNSDARALLSVGQAALTLEYEIDAVNVDLQLLSEAFEVLSYDSSTLNNYEYVQLLKRFAEAKQKLNSLIEILGLLKLGLDKGILSRSVTVIEPSGNTREYSLTSSINNMEDRMYHLSKAITGLSATVAENFLVDIWGLDYINLAMGKQLINLGKKYNEALNAIDSERRTRDLIHEALHNPPEGKDWEWLVRFGSILNSSSIVNQLVGLALNLAKTIGQQETQKTLSYIQKLRSQYKRGTVEESYTTPTGMFVGKVYGGKDIDALVERDVNGVLTGNLIRPVDYYTYEQELKDKEKEWSEEFIAKYKNELLNDTQKAMYWSAFRQNKFNEWNKVTDPITGKSDYRFKKQSINLTNPKTGEVEEILIYAPNPIMYPNSKWNGLSKTDLELSNQLMSLKYYSNSKLNGQGSALHKIPNFRGSFTDTFLNNKKKLGSTAMAKMRRNMVADMEDTEFGSIITEIPMIEQAQRDWAVAEVDAIKRIPLYGIRPLKDMRELSTDLWSSYLAYDDMANQYATKNSIETMIQTVGERIQETDNLAKTEFHHDPRYYESFLNYIDKELYGITKKTYGKSAIVTLTKHLNTLGKIVTAAFLGGNVHSALVNLITGYNEIVKEAGVGQYINVNDLMGAFAFYLTHSASKIVGADNGHYNVWSHPNDSTNMLSVILRSFDFTERYLQDTRNYNTRELGITRLLKNSLMLPYEYTDHWMQTVPLLCFLKHQKVYTLVDPSTNTSNLVTLLEALFPNTQGDRYKHVLGTPQGIDSDGNFGLFYKDAEGAQQGTKIVSLIQKLNQYGKQLTENPGATLNNLTADDLAVLLSLDLPINIDDASMLNTALSTLKNKLYTLSYNGADFARTKMLAREIVNRMHGVYDTLSKGSFARTIYGATFMSMKNYAVGLINKRFGQPHYSVLTQLWDEGTLWSVSKAILDAGNAVLRGHEKHNRFVYACKSLFNIIAPFALSTKASKERMAKRTGFSVSLIYNIQRNKMDMLRITFFQLLSHITQALGKGWFGGWDPEDEDLFYEYTGLNIDREDILEGDAFEDGGDLASNPKLETIWAEIQGINESDPEIRKQKQAKFNEMVSGLSDFEKQVLTRLANDASSSAKLGGSIRFDAYGSSKNGFEKYLDKVYKEEEKKWNNMYGTSLDISKNNGVSLHKIKQFCKDNYITTGKIDVKPILDENGKQVYYSRDGKYGKKGDPKFEVKYKVRNTPMSAIQEEKENVAKEVKDLKLHVEYAQGDLKKHLQELLKQKERRLTGLTEILHGYNLWSAKQNNIKLSKELKQWAKRTNISDKNIEAIALQVMKSTDEDIKKFMLFKQDYDKNQKVIETLRKYFNSKKFEQDYFENTHPAAHYWLGVVNYFVYRGLLELESFIPLAGVATQQAEKILTEIIPKTFTGKRLIPEIKRDWEWNATNEWSSWTEGVAALGLGRTFGKFLDALVGSLFYPNNYDYMDKLKEADEIKLGSKDLEYTNMTDYLNEGSREQQAKDRAERIAEREKAEEEYRKAMEYIAKNTTNKLKKGDPIYQKYLKQFGFYYRTWKMFGVGEYLNEGKTDGGWRATESYKSFYLKDRK